MKRMSDAVKAGIRYLLNKHLPGRTKRLIFLASFSARLTESTNFDNATLKKLNEAMVLANSESAMKLPWQLSKAIWDGRTVYDICDENVCTGTFTGERIKHITQRVIDAMPSWLRYGDDKVIESDISRLLDNRQIVLG